LMIALESIFNKSSQEPIKHIISRHTALTITRNKQKFFEIVERVKFLYNLRSWIVHGDNKKFSKHSTKFPTYILELEELVRNVLKQLIWNEKLFDSKKPTTKEELFDILNASAPLVGPISN